jgi:hypothetical protein
MSSQLFEFGHAPDRRPYRSVQSSFTRRLYYHARRDNPLWPMPISAAPPNNLHVILVKLVPGPVAVVVRSVFSKNYIFR